MQEVGNDANSFEPQDALWRNRSKHVFALALSGKPVYTRYGSPCDYSDIFAVLRVLVSLAETVDSYSRNENETRAHQVDEAALKRVCFYGTTDRQMHFYANEQLIYVMITRTAETAESCRRQLKLLHAQIATLFPIQEIMGGTPSLDVGELIASNDVRLLRRLQKRMSYEPSYVFHALQAAEIYPKYREEIEKILCAPSAYVGSSHLQTLLLHGPHIIAGVAAKGMTLHVEDILVLINIAESVTQTQSGEQWIPLVLSNSSSAAGTVWCYLRRFHPCTLVQLSNSSEHFEAYSNAAESLLKELRSPLFPIHNKLPAHTISTVPEEFNLPRGVSVGLFWFVAFTRDAQLLVSKPSSLLTVNSTTLKHTLRQMVRVREELAEVFSSRGNGQGKPLVAHCSAQLLVVGVRPSGLEAALICAAPHLAIEVVVEYAARMAVWVLKRGTCDLAQRSLSWGTR